MRACPEFCTLLSHDDDNYCYFPVWHILRKSSTQWKNWNNVLLNLVVHFQIVLLQSLAIPHEFECIWEKKLTGHSKLYMKQNLNCFTPFSISALFTSQSNIALNFSFPRIFQQWISCCRLVLKRFIKRVGNHLKKLRLSLSWIDFNS